MNAMKLPIEYSKATPTERREAREWYRKLQHNRCQYCGASLSGPPASASRNKKVSPELYPGGFFLNPVHLHHDHKTDLTIGAVHAHCNAVLWEYYGE